MQSKRKYNYPYIESDEFFPDSYTLSMLAYTSSWRNNENIEMLAKSLNHIKAFHPDLIDSILYRRVLTEIAMLGVGEQVDIIRESALNVRNALDDNGILRMNYAHSHNKRYSPKKLLYPTPYTDIRLEPDYNSKNALLCNLTFWAVQFLYLVEGKF